MAELRREDQRVTVAVRVRPKLEGVINTQQNSERYFHEAAAKTGDTTIRLADGKSGKDSRSYNFCFDSIFDKDSTQLDVYEETTLDAVDAVLQGCNATIMCYGQTGSGKTYTVLGTVKNNPLSDDIITSNTGLFLRVLKDLLSYAEKHRNDTHIIICLSVVEIYLDTLRDLLSLGQQGTTIKMVISGDQVMIPDLTYKQVSELRDAVAAYRQAMNRRVSRATDANDQSSRSHAVFTIDVYQQAKTSSNPDPPSLEELIAARDKGQKALASGKTASPLSASATFQGVQLDRVSNPLILLPKKPPVLYSKLVLADLAGSEKANKSNAKGEGFEELKKINVSLTALGNVVHSLFEGAKHVPYRDSKLTIVLRESFASPSSRIVLIANVSPTALTIDETLSTMFFADKVKAMKVENPLGADVAKLEVEYLNTLRDLEEIASDLRIAQEMCEYTASMRLSRNSRVFNMNTRTPVKYASNSQREKELRAIHDFAAARSMAAQEAKKAERERELASLSQTIVEQSTASHLAARARAQASLDHVIVQGASEEKDFVEVSSELSEEIASLSAEAEGRARELTLSRAQMDHLPGAVERARAEVARLEAAVLAMEQKFMAEYKEAEDEWAAVKAEHRRQDERFARDSAWFDKHFGYWSTRCEFLATTTYATSVFTIAAALRRESEMCEISEWIRQAVMAMAGNAVALSQKAIGAKKPSMRPAPATPRAGSVASNASSVVSSVRPPPPRVLPSGTGAGSPSTSPPPSSGPGGEGEAAASTTPSEQTRVVEAPRHPRQQASLYDQPTLLGEIDTYAQVGCAMLKYGRSGSPHYRVFYILTTDAAGPRLCWDDQDSGRRLGLGSSIELKSVQKVYLGQSTEVFKRQPNPETFYTSFSLMYVHKQQLRSLDISADTDAEFEAWVIAICAATKLSPIFPEKLENVEVMPGAAHLLPQDLAYCGAWHIPPQLFVSTRNRIEEMVKRRKGHAVRMTPGDFRFFAQIDIFRACALWRRFREHGIVELSMSKLYWYLDFEDSTTSQTN